MAKKKTTKAKQPQPQSSQNKCFTKRFFITGFGMVDVGDQVSEAAATAWAATTKADINKYTIEIE